MHKLNIGYLLLFVGERGREIHDSANLTADQANDHGGESKSV